MKLEQEPGDRGRIRRRGIRTLPAVCAVLGVAVLLCTTTAARNQEVHPPIPDSACEATGARQSAGATYADPGAHDFDGDGHRDLALAVPFQNGPDDVYQTGRIALLPGTAHGPDPERRKVFTPEDFQLPENDGMAPTRPSPVVADLDGDGHPDLLAGGMAHVQWGGPDGPDPAHEPATIRLPHAATSDPAKTSDGTGSYREPPVAGDFDGDGHTDLALGDSGIPSDEEAEPEDRPGKVTIRYGKAPGAPVVIEGGPRKGGFGVELAAGDLDGDGCDDLAVERAGDRDGGTDGTDVLHGGSSPGLGSRPWLPARPHRAGHPTAADDLFGDGRDALLLDSGVRKKNGWGWWFTDLAGKEPAHYDKDQLGHTAQTSRGGR